jgi:hypothetical protein
MPKHKSFRVLPGSHRDQPSGSSNDHPIDYLPAYADQSSTGDHELPEYAEGPSYRPPPSEKSAEVGGDVALGPSGSLSLPEKSPQELGSTASEPSRTFQLKDNRDNVRLSVTIFGSVNLKGSPIIHPGEIIRGHLTVDAGDRQKNVKSVVLAVRASSVCSLFALIASRLLDE